MPESIRSTPLWPLPLSIALLFLGAVHLAWWLSMQQGHIPACVPYWDGCTSISRAARHGLGNSLFRLAVLPCALLHGLNWWLARAWLRRPERARDVVADAMLVLGALSALALAIYTTFLGTEGEIYRFLRRYGVVVYFGFGFLAQLLFLRLARREGKLMAGIGSAMLAICVAMLALGLGNVIASLVLTDAVLKDHLENALEWQLGLLLVAWFVLQAVLWKRARFAMVIAR
ncbi:hypothetical protein [Pseudoxanthomonas sp. UTMC 1351]|uniref:hypothetical protein n=1 Tax=Pseudoxanthomonas sp. UTMC 1351 TaxID=2695853 RepID=UPI0034CDD564